MTEQTSERVARATDQTSERVLSWLLIGEWLTLSLLKCHMDVTMTSMNQCCRLIQSERVHSYGMGAEEKKKLLKGLDSCGQSLVFFSRCTVLFRPTALCFCVQENF